MYLFLLLFLLNNMDPRYRAGPSGFPEYYHTTIQPTSTNPSNDPTSNVVNSITSDPERAARLNAIYGPIPDYQHPVPRPLQHPGSQSHQLSVLPTKLSHASRGHQNTVHQRGSPVATSNNGTSWSCLSTAFYPDPRDSKWSTVASKSRSLPQGVRPLELPHDNVTNALLHAEATCLMQDIVISHPMLPFHFLFRPNLKNSYHLTLGYVFSELCAKVENPLEPKEVE